ncbi:TetR family transcriptional regulator [Pseudoroseomonas wenyumeiae]|uniref:TetR family transcriptional regulator n=1 Tax=Teichococcus wenyumeiae TaxID=2478470 RepID=A0A3A9JC55_9PROT|nr:TetR/AcrR family transcriptional regulator [Pseudoroseomonas wenyumeiae]RKK03730.1 TetR/AcrR family transcriptional regulator [Pseudoroseomonas wenyumeiae]RMI20476.1 TetR family transcriptional regulator [Pseudoroseomonas wenyumeiae]
MARPREFDPEEALQAALMQFWQKGYEGTSIADLTAAMGITKPSLYACFGNKEELFRKALDSYEARYRAISDAALAEPDTRRAVERLLQGYADLLTRQGMPHGCLGLNGAIACSPDSESVRQELIHRRLEAEAVVARRLERAREEGDLPADASPDALARYLMAVAMGLAVQAKAGATREMLGEVVELTMAGWPGGTRRRPAEALASAEA